MTPADPVGVGAQNYFRGKDPAGVGVEKKIRVRTPPGLGSKIFFGTVGVGVKNIFRGHDPAGVGIGKKNGVVTPHAPGPRIGVGIGVLPGLTPATPVFVKIRGQIENRGQHRGFVQWDFRKNTSHVGG